MYRADSLTTAAMELARYELYLMGVQDLGGTTRAQ